MVQILDGKIVRDKIAEELKAEISRLNSKCKLVIIQVGDLAESNTYIAQKVKFGQRIGAIVDHIKLPENISQKDLISQLLTLNSQLDIHGVIVQMPIPKTLDKDTIIDAIDPKKDVDGQTSTNIKWLFEGSSDPVIPAPSEGGSAFGGKAGIQKPAEHWIPDQVPNDKGMFHGYIPATTKGILTLLDYYKIPVEGKHVVIIGRSSLVGKPTALAFLNRDATVTVCHSKTRNLKRETRNADILIVAAGQPKLITKDHVAKGQVVIDVGINVIDELAVPNVITSGFDKLTVNSTKQSQKKIATSASWRTRNDKVRKLIGDVDFESVSKIVKAISPVPGGCGPMTVASLFQNLLQANNKQSFSSNKQIGI